MWIRGFILSADWSAVTNYLSDAFFFGSQISHSFHWSFGSCEHSQRNTFARTHTYSINNNKRFMHIPNSTTNFRLGTKICAHRLVIKIKFDRWLGYCSKIREFVMQLWRPDFECLRIRSAHMRRTFIASQSIAVGSLYCTRWIFWLTLIVLLVPCTFSYKPSR